MNDYFKKMLSQLETNKLTEAEMLQLFTDMIKMNYVWDKPELALHARILIEKGMIQPPPHYIHREVKPEEVLAVQANRELIH